MGSQSQVWQTSRLRVMSCFAFLQCLSELLQGQATALQQAVPSWASLDDECETEGCALQALQREGLIW